MRLDPADGRACMSTLGERAIAALRRQLHVLEGGYPQLQRLLRRSLRVPPLEVQPGSEASLRDLLIRDVLAFAAISVAQLFGGSCFGGFVREMLSGKVRNDIDLCFLSRFHIQHFKQTLCTQLARIFGTNRLSFHLEHTSVHTHYGFTMHRHRLTFTEPQAVHALQMDISVLRRCIRPPATLGSILHITPDNQLAKRITHEIPLSCIQDMLVNGQEIEMWPTLHQWQRTPQPDRLAVYHSTVRTKMEAKGYVFRPLSLGLTPTQRTS